MNPHRGKFPGIGTGCTLRYSSNFQESRVWLQAIYLICIRLYKGERSANPSRMFNRAKLMAFPRIVLMHS